jgi:preprotein translocase subunit YajC
MTQLDVTALLVAANNSTKTTSSGSSVFLIVLIGIVAVVYFAFIRPQQQRTRQQREKSRQVEVGDEVLTVGGIVGRVVEVGDDRITIESGAEGDGAASGAVPTRLVVVKQGIARKIEPVVAEAPEEGEEAGSGNGPPEEGPRK